MGIIDPEEREGSPPRLRETLDSVWAHHLKHRITPAPAGNTVEIKKWRKKRRDHPRACGKHVVT